MSDLKKGDLVMHPVYKLLWVRGVKGDTLTCKPVSTKVTRTLRAIFAKEITKATKEQVTEYIRGLGHYMNNDEVIVHGSVIFFDALDCIRIKPCQLGERDFPTALAQLAEAIQVAQLLNAVKD